VEREVARVAAACDLKAFRYLAFPATYFDPLPIAPPADPEPVEAAIKAPAEVLVEAPPVIAALLPEPVASPAVAAGAAAATPPPPAPPVEPASIRAPQPASRAVPPQRHFSMLQDLGRDPPPDAAAHAPAGRPAARSVARPAMPALPTARLAGHSASTPAAAPTPRIAPGSPRGTPPRRAWPQ
jgi:hypothetical protein